MSGGGSTSLKQEPPAWATPYLQNGLSGAATQLNQGKQIAPFSQATTQAQNMVQNRATSGDPTINAATKYVQDSLGGNFLNSNPYLDATFNKAAMATQSQLASQFAGSGRNVNQSEGNRAGQLGDLATSIYGGAYENDRNRQQASLAYAQPLGNQAYTDAAALSAVGSQQEAKTQQQLDAPGTALDDYLRRVNGTVNNLGSTSVQSSKSDPLSNIAGGALLLNDLTSGGSGSGLVGQGISKGVDYLGNQFGGLFGSGSTAANATGEAGTVGDMSQWGGNSGAGTIGNLGAVGGAAFGGFGAPAGTVGLESLAGEPLLAGGGSAAGGAASGAAGAAAGASPYTWGAIAPGLAAGAGAFGLAALGNQWLGNNDPYVLNDGVSYDGATGTASAGNFSAQFNQDKGLMKNTNGTAYKDASGRTYDIPLLNGRTGNNAKMIYEYLQKQGASLPAYQQFVAEYDALGAHQ